MSSKNSLKELKAKCSGYGLKTYGKKETFIDRISKYEQSKILETKLIESEDEYDDEYYEDTPSNSVNVVIIDLPINEILNSSVGSIDSDDYQLQNTESNKRTRVITNYSLLGTFDDKNSALEVIKNDNTWNKERTRYP